MELKRPEARGEDRMLFKVSYSVPNEGEYGYGESLTNFRHRLQPKKARGQMFS